MNADPLQSSGHIIRCVSVSKQFRSGQSIIQDLTLDVQRGELLGITGTSAGGKSVLAALIAGQLAPTSGSIFVADIAVRQNMPAIQSFLNYLPQTSDLPLFMTPFDWIVLQGTLRGMPGSDARSAAKDLLERAHLADRSRWSLRNLTEPQRQLVRCCAAMMGYPHILLLDDPTRQFDLAQRIWFWDLMQQIQREAKMTVVVISQDIDELDAFANRVAFMRQGQIIALGAVATLKEQYTPGPRMEMRLSPNMHLTPSMLQQLRALGRVQQDEPDRIILYPKADAIGELARSIPMPINAPVAVSIPQPRGRRKQAQSLQDQFSRSDLIADSWLLDTQTIPGSLGRTVEEIMAIIGRQQVREFWFSPPTLRDVYLHLEGGLDRD